MEIFFNVEKRTFKSTLNIRKITEAVKTKILNASIIHFFTLLFICVFKLSLVRVFLKFGDTITNYSLLKNTLFSGQSEFLRI